MPLFFINDDITKLKVDAIVNAANNTLLGGGGVDGCIHHAAGPELLEECKTLNGCDTGDAKVTKGYNLPAKYVIHTVGPVWEGGNQGEEKMLISCYNRSLMLAVENNCKSIAFPLISTVIYGYPKVSGMKVAVNSVNSFLAKLEEDLDVYLVLYGKEANNYIDLRNDTKTYFDKAFADIFKNNVLSITTSVLKSVIGPVYMGMYKNVIPTLEKALEKPDESFSSMVMRKIKEEGMSDVSCYKAANVNRQIFSRIRSSAGENAEDNYQPNKNTALAFAIALKLSLKDSYDLLKKAGFTFSNSNKTDIIVEYCIKNSIYDISMVNEILFYYNQPLLGSKSQV